MSEDKRPDLNTDNSKARYYVPHIVRINFIDDKSGAVMFTFVPKCEDENTFIEAFALLNAYDRMRMDLFSFIKKNELGG